MHTDQTLVWHYTTGEKFKRIVSSGVLLPTAIGVVPPEKPVLWFSEHPYFEPTAIKLIRTNSGVRLATLQEMYREGAGLCRFGYPTDDLFHHKALQKEAMIPRAQWKSLESVARSQRSNPLHWWGTTKSISIDRLTVEVMNEVMAWELVQEPDWISEFILMG